METGVYPARARVSATSERVATLASKGTAHQRPEVKFVVHSSLMAALRGHRMLVLLMGHELWWRGTTCRPASL